uniref:PIN domain-containing protein n=1 Tax=Candidatus Kentrum sp. TUN TaxID=2126343 RepID=A0A451B0Z2_9GAMM|nr:MAG: PIN domain-containing protein [Candidatus Kentron sp. TUN]VFK71948.1 MAG: PIN domain-containing protein [Candidatus Kentron sp. TUN]
MRFPVCAAKTRSIRTIHIFKLDWEIQYKIVEIEKSDFEKASRLVQKHPLRAYDAIQLACALKVPSATFLSADNRLIDIAQAEGLNVGNPNTHP